MSFELLAMVNVEMFRKFGNISVDNVVEEKSLTTAVRADEASTSAVSFQDQVGILKKDLVSVRSLHGEALNLDILWKSLSGSQLESLEFGEACNNVISFGVIASIQWLLGFVWFSHLICCSFFTTLNYYNIYM